MGHRYGALLSRFNRMLVEDVNNLFQQDIHNRNAAHSIANQTQITTALKHVQIPFKHELGPYDDLAWRLNCIGAYVDPQRMAALANEIKATDCRLSGNFNVCCFPGRKLQLTSSAVNSTSLLDEVCSLVQFQTKGRRIDDKGFQVSQGGKTRDSLHRPLRYVEKATKLLAVYVLVSDHTRSDFLCTYDI